MHIDEFQSLTAGLRGLGGQRVWSLMISLFGDLAQDKGQSIDGPILSEIMGGLSVKPEAARVALHRLRNDDWIMSEKAGRISHHSLTAKGRAECAAANPRIYADPMHGTGRWQMVLTQSASVKQSIDMAKRGFTQVTSRVFAGPSDAIAPDDALGLSAHDVPEWMQQQIAPQEQAEGYQKLLKALTEMKPRLPDSEALNPIEIAVLRCLIVHNWRRLVLKHTKLPLPLIDPDGPAHQCQLHVADMLASYPRPELAEIERYCAAA